MLFERWGRRGLSWTIHTSLSTGFVIKTLMRRGSVYVGEAEEEEEGLSLWSRLEPLEDSRRRETCRRVLDLSTYAVARARSCVCTVPLAGAYGCRMLDWPWSPANVKEQFVFVFGEGLSLCQLGLCAEDGFVCVLNEKESCAFARAR